MIGLVKKDIYLLKDISKVFGLMIILEIVVLFVEGSVDFVLGYMTIFSAMMIINTVSYDEKSMGFLLTLPISRKQYVAEKYLFGFVAGILLEVFNVGIVLIYFVVNQAAVDWIEFGTKIGIYFGIMLLAQVIVLPVLLKFGAEKARIIIIIVFMGGFILTVKLMDFIFQSNADLKGQAVMFMTNNTGAAAAIGIAAELLCIVISVFISMKIAEYKEY